MALVRHAGLDHLTMAPYARMPGPLLQAFTGAFGMFFDQARLHMIPGGGGSLFRLLPDLRVDSVAFRLQIAREGWDRMAGHVLSDQGLRRGLV
jgi:hypothetical protein